MNRAVTVVLLLVVLALVVVGALYIWAQTHPATIPPPPPTRIELPPVEPQGPRNPVPNVPTEKPLPALNASDADVRSALSQALTPGALERLVFEDFIRKVVATIDNLPREQYASRLNPVKPVPGVPKVNGKDETLIWSHDNNQRYAPFIAAFEAVDASRLADFYLRYYPLFQQAYVELGYPQGYFNDRLIEVIDHLLVAPEPKGPLKLTQPKVLYEFADPELQQLSAGQKAMVRIGRANEEKVKEKLREIRAKVAPPR
jgi:hypothetical protein